MVHYQSTYSNHCAILRQIFVTVFLTQYTAAVAVAVTSVTRLGDLLDFGQLFKAFGNN